MIPDGIIFNAYPDSCGGNLKSLAELLGSEKFQGIFRYVYILPSMFQSDLDRGFSVISYNLDSNLASFDDLAALGNSGLELKLDFVLNHLSVQSPQFRDLLENGDDSPYVDAFIDWNKFWKGFGDNGEGGYIIPDERYLRKLFTRKPGLPILKVPFPDGTSRFYWNTFYQSVSIAAPSSAELMNLDGIDASNASAIQRIIQESADSGTPIHDMDFGEHQNLRDAVIEFVNYERTEYRGQVDLNAKSEIVWQFYRETFEKLASYGARIVRLDAFAYLHKEVGFSNFFNEPGTWEYLDRIQDIANHYGIVLLPEIHSRHEDGTHRKLADYGYPFYDFFFPALLINALETKSAEKLAAWINEIQSQGYLTINMLGCHDGIPALDVKGILAESSIEEMIGLITRRGGRVKNLFGPDGKRISYYQVNATFFSALGANERKMLLARAIQLFMPGIPQIWYLDLFAGANDIEAADRDGHKEINRTNLTMKEIENRVSLPIVQKQLELLRFRSQFPSFGNDSTLEIDSDNPQRLMLTWKKDKNTATLDANLSTLDFSISYRDHKGHSSLVI